MDIVSIIVVLILVGGALYIATLLPIDATIKKIIQVVVVLAAVLWLFAQFGYGPGVRFRGHR